MLCCFRPSPTTGEPAVSANCKEGAVSAPKRLINDIITCQTPSSSCPPTGAAGNGYDGTHKASSSHVWKPSARGFGLGDMHAAIPWSQSVHDALALLVQHLDCSGAGLWVLTPDRALVTQIAHQSTKRHNGVRNGGASDDGAVKVAPCASASFLGTLTAPIPDCLAIGCTLPLRAPLVCTGPTPDTAAADEAQVLQDQISQLLGFGDRQASPGSARVLPLFARGRVMGALTLSTQARSPHASADASASAAPGPGPLPTATASQRAYPQSAAAAAAPITSAAKDPEAFKAMVRAGQFAAAATAPDPRAGDQSDQGAMDPASGGTAAAAACPAAALADSFCRAYFSADWQLLYARQAAGAAAAVWQSANADGALRALCTALEPMLQASLEGRTPGLKLCIGLGMVERGKLEPTLLLHAPHASFPACMPAVSTLLAAAGDDGTEDEDVHRQCSGDSGGGGSPLQARLSPGMHLLVPLHMASGSLAAASGGPPAHAAAAATPRQRLRAGAEPDVAHVCPQGWQLVQGGVLVDELPGSCALVTYACLASERQEEAVGDGSSSSSGIGSAGRAPAVGLATPSPTAMTDHQVLELLVHAQAVCQVGLMVLRDRLCRRWKPVAAGRSPSASATGSGGGRIPRTGAFDAMATEAVQVPKPLPSCGGGLVPLLSVQAQQLPMPLDISLLPFRAQGSSAGCLAAAAAARPAASGSACDSAGGAPVAPQSRLTDISSVTISQPGSHTPMPDVSGDAHNRSLRAFKDLPCDSALAGTVAGGPNASLEAEHSSWCASPHVTVTGPSSWLNDAWGTSTSGFGTTTGTNSRLAGASVAASSTTRNMMMSQMESSCMILPQAAEANCALHPSGAGGAAACRGSIPGAGDAVPDNGRVLATATHAQTWTEYLLTVQHPASHQLLDPCSTGGATPARGGSSYPDECAGPSSGGAGCDTWSPAGPSSGAPGTGSTAAVTAAATSACVQRDAPAARHRAALVVYLSQERVRTAAGAGASVPATGAVAAAPADAAPAPAAPPPPPPAALRADAAGLPCSAAVEPDSTAWAAPDAHLRATVAAAAPAVAGTPEAAAAAAVPATCAPRPPSSSSPAGSIGPGPREPATSRPIRVVELTRAAQQLVRNGSSGGSSDDHKRATLDLVVPAPDPMSNTQQHAHAPLQQAAVGITAAAAAGAVPGGHVAAAPTPRRLNRLYAPTRMVTARAIEPPGEGVAAASRLLLQPGAAAMNSCLPQPAATALAMVQSPREQNCSPELAACGDATAAAPCRAAEPLQHDILPMPPAAMPSPAAAPPALPPLVHRTRSVSTHAQQSLSDYAIPENAALQATLADTVSMMRSLAAARSAQMACKLRRVRVSTKLHSVPHEADLPAGFAARAAASVPEMLSQAGGGGAAAAAAAAAGGGSAWVLTGFAVRRGCLELVMDLVEVPEWQAVTADSIMGAGDVPAKGPAAGDAGQEPDAVRFASWLSQQGVLQPHLEPCIQVQVGAQVQAVRWSSERAIWVADGAPASGAQAPEAELGTGTRTADANPDALQQQDRSASIDLPSGPMLAAMLEAAGPVKPASPARAAQELEPPAVWLERCAAAVPAPGAEGGGKGDAVTIEALVLARWHTGSSAASLELTVRTSSGYLPTRVVNRTVLSRSWPPANAASSGSSAAAGASAAAQRADATPSVLAAAAPFPAPTRVETTGAGAISPAGVAAASGPDAVPQQARSGASILDWCGSGRNSVSGLGPHPSLDYLQRLRSSHDQDPMVLERVTLEVCGLPPAGGLLLVEAHATAGAVSAAAHGADAAPPSSAADPAPRVMSPPVPFMLVGDAATAAELCQAHARVSALLLCEGADVGASSSAEGASMLQQWCEAGAAGNELLLDLGLLLDAAAAAPASAASGEAAAATPAAQRQLLADTACTVLSCCIQCGMHTTAALVMRASQQLALCSAEALLRAALEGAPEYDDVAIGIAVELPAPSLVVASAAADGTAVPAAAPSPAPAAVMASVNARPCSTDSTAFGNSSSNTARQSAAPPSSVAVAVASSPSRAPPPSGKAPPAHRGGRPVSVHKGASAADHGTLSSPMAPASPLTAAADGKLTAAADGKLMAAADGKLMAAADVLRRAPRPDREPTQPSALQLLQPPHHEVPWLQEPATSSAVVAALTTAGAAATSRVVPRRPRAAEGLRPGGAPGDAGGGGSSGRALQQRVPGLPVGREACRGELLQQLLPSLARCVLFGFEDRQQESMYWQHITRSTLSVFRLYTVLNCLFVAATLTRAWREDGAAVLLPLVLYLGSQAAVMVWYNVWHAGQGGALWCCLVVLKLLRNTSRLLMALGAWPTPGFVVPVVHVGGDILNEGLLCSSAEPMPVRWALLVTLLEVPPLWLFYARIEMSGPFWLGDALALRTGLYAACSVFVTVCMEAVRRRGYLRLLAQRQLDAGKAS